MENSEMIDSSHAVFRMPKQAVVFLKGTDRTKDKLSGSEVTEICIIQI